MSVLLISKIVIQGSSNDAYVTALRPTKTVESIMLFPQNLCNLLYRKVLGDLRCAMCCVMGVTLLFNTLHFLINLPNYVKILILTMDEYQVNKILFNQLFYRSQNSRLGLLYIMFSMNSFFLLISTFRNIL